MFALFFNLYLAMFRGSWTDFNLQYIYTMVSAPMNKLGELLTSLFNNVETPVTDFGDVFLQSATIGYNQIPSYMALASFVLALITSIGIVAMAVKGVKKAFGIFFMGLR